MSNRFGPVPSPQRGARWTIHAPASRRASGSSRKPRMRSHCSKSQVPERTRAPPAPGRLDGSGFAQTAHALALPANPSEVNRSHCGIATRTERDKRALDKVLPDARTRPTRRHRCVFLRERNAAALLCARVGAPRARKNCAHGLVGVDTESSSCSLFGGCSFSTDPPARGRSAARRVFLRLRG